PVARGAVAEAGLDLAPDVDGARDEACGAEIVGAGEEIADRLAGDAGVTRAPHRHARRRDLVERHSPVAAQARERRRLAGEALPPAVGVLVRLRGAARDRAVEARLGAVIGERLTGDREANDARAVLPCIDDAAQIDADLVVPARSSFPKSTWGRRY